MGLNRMVWYGLVLVLPLFLWPLLVGGQEYEKWDARIAEYKRWLDSVGSTGSRLWLRLNSKRRPHRLYVGKSFYNLDYKGKEEFIEIFSHYLAGHPEKFALVDIFDARTEKRIGEFGWGGFKLY
ncbi:MAG: hypothetical protein ACE5JU_01470 [Candidatus Binatia bacterium]